VEEEVGGFVFIMILLFWKYIPFFSWFENLTSLACLSGGVCFHVVRACGAMTWWRRARMVLGTAS
jgi:hypothetical protein